MEYDVVIVGAGPAGLSTAIRLKQIAEEQDTEINVCIIEKGVEVGSHILSGNVFNPKALTELWPKWKEDEAPLTTEAKDEHVYYFTESGSFPLPIPPPMHNEGNYIISLGNLCRWLGEKAEDLGVEIYPGFSASEMLFDEDGSVMGIATGDMGLMKDGTPGDNFARGMEILAAQTVLGEGCRGSLSEQIMKHFDLRANSDPQTYGLGLKEVWDIDPEKCKPGTILHTMGWPLNMDTYGGGFFYMTEENQAFVGFVVGLDYKNPYISPYEEFQCYKTHPKIKEILEGGTCRSYGARCINEGGYQAIPKLTFPGGMMAGCSAGFLNVPAIKGSHYAMKTGILAGEAIFANHMGEQKKEVTEYEDKVRDSWVWSELKAVRNCKPSFQYGGQIPMVLHSGLSTFITKGSEPWTIKTNHTDSECTKPAKDFKPIQYPKPDGKLTFDILTNVARSGTYHESDEPVHLKIKPELAHVPEKESLQTYGAPESRFCPAKVYEYLPDENGEEKLVINSQNCVHCKCCSIKMPKEYINWTVPQGASGPQYANM